MKIAASVRAKVEALPRGVAEQLGHRLRELAELAELHPVSHAHEAPVTMQLLLERLRVQYEVDRDRKRLTVTGVTAVAAASGQDSGSSGAA